MTREWGRGSAGGVQVLISCPYPLDSSHGNVVSARRWEGVIGEAGFEVRVEEGWGGEGAKVLVALHAVRSAGVVKRFRERCPTGKVVVVLTGTDLYGDLLDESSVAHEVLKWADGLVVLNEVALSRMPLGYRQKTRVIGQSVELPDLGEGEREVVPTFAVVGHLREVKRPFLAVEALQKREGFAARVWQVGGEREVGFGERAREWEAEEGRYCWWGGMEREEALRLVVRSWAVVNSSRMEGGSNALLEAMILGVPVLASRIDGNVGLLGGDYAGYFEEGDEEELGVLMERLVEDEIFQMRLRMQMEARVCLFTRALEVEGWREMLEGLI